MPLSRITPAIAPATALGRERVETFKNFGGMALGGRGGALTSSSRAIGAAWDALVVMRSSSRVLLNLVWKPVGWSPIVEVEVHVQTTLVERADLRGRSAASDALPGVIDGAKYHE